MHWGRQGSLPLGEFPAMSSYTRSQKPWQHQRVRGLHGQWLPMSHLLPVSIQLITKVKFSSHSCISPGYSSMTQSLGAFRCSAETYEFLICPSYSTGVRLVGCQKSSLIMFGSLNVRLTGRFGGQRGAHEKRILRTVTRLGNI